jgi:uncharacterized cupin superfamily protein
MIAVDDRATSRRHDTMTIRPIRFDPTAQGDSDAETSFREWYGDPTGAFSAGLWTSLAWRKEVRYDEDEFCLILEGTVRLTDADGRTETYGPGDAFVIPSGFTGVWESVTPVRKFYVVHVPKPAA